MDARGWYPIVQVSLRQTEERQRIVQFRRFDRAAPGRRRGKGRRHAAISGRSRIDGDLGVVEPVVVGSRSMPRAEGRAERDGGMSAEGNLGFGREVAYPPIPRCTFKPNGEGGLRISNFGGHSSHLRIGCGSIEKDDASRISAFFPTTEGGDALDVYSEGPCPLRSPAIVATAPQLVPSISKASPPSYFNSSAERVMVPSWRKHSTGRTARSSRRSTPTAERASRRSARAWVSPVLPWASGSAAYARTA